MSNARGYPLYPPRGKKPHGPSRRRFYTGPPSSRRSRDQDGRDLLYDLHTITGQSEGTHTHATQTKRREHRTGPAVRGAEPEERNTVTGKRQRVMEKERILGQRKKEGYSRREGGTRGGREAEEEAAEEEEEDEEEERVRTWGGSRRAVLDSSPGAVGMSMSGSRRGSLSRTPAT